MPVWAPVKTRKAKTKSLRPPRHHRLLLVGEPSSCDEGYKAAQKSEGEITDVSYMFPKPGSEQQLAPKVAFVTRVGELACAVGYYQ